MTTYYIYNIATDEYYGEVKASSVISAERKALTELNINESSEFVAAFSYKLN